MPYARQDAADRPADVALPDGGPASTARATFVLVHGAWHHAGCLAGLARELAALGHTAVAVDLPGHGQDAAFPAAYGGRPLDAAALAVEPSPLVGITVDECASRLVAVLDGLRAAGHSKVVLVGHSMGGVAVTEVAEREAAKLHAIVYLAGMMLPRGASVLDAVSGPEGADSLIGALLIGDPARIGALRIDFRSGDPAYLETVKACFYGDASDAEFRAAAHALTPDEPILLGVTPAGPTPERWGSVARHYMGSP